jgi:hypothetical protein
MTTRALKNKYSNNAKPMASGDDRYLLRRKVMDVLYLIKANGFNIPRVEVRICDSMDATAYAYLGKNIVHVNRQYMTEKHEYMFVQIVLHEVVHAVFGVGEVVGCPLMHCSEVWNIKPSKDVAWEKFNKYYCEWLHKTDK